LWDAEREFTVDATQLQQRHKITPYAGRRLRGVVHTTYLRGERLWDRGRLERPWSGQVL
jgi:allantoinase